MALLDGHSTSIDWAFPTCIWVNGFRARPAGSFTWDPTLWWSLLIQKISRVSPAAGGTAHTSYICPAPIRRINGFWLYRFIPPTTSEGGRDRCSDGSNGVRYSRDSDVGQASGSMTFRIET